MRTIICLTPLQPTRAKCNILDTFYFKCYFRVSGYPSDHFGEFKEIFSSPNMIHKIFPAHIAFQKLIYLQTTFTGVPDTFPYFPVSEAFPLERYASHNHSHCVKATCSACQGSQVTVHCAGLSSSVRTRWREHRELLRQENREMYLGPQ